MFIDYQKGKKLFEKVISDYENILNKFSYKKYSINKDENVYIIEDSFIIYIGLINYFTNSSFPQYHALFEEFLYNEIFKFNISAFARNFDYGFIQYKKFNGSLRTPIIRTNEEILLKSKFDYIDKNLPFLKIEERYKNWNGFLYNFIVFELKGENSTGYAICSTKDYKIHSTALKKCDDLEYGALLNIHYINNSNSTYYYKGLNIDQSMVKLIIDILKQPHHNIKKNSNKLGLTEGYLKYFVVPTYIKNNYYNIQMDILEKAQKGEYDYLPRYDYIIPENKWKSEQLVYELTTKIFKKNKVIYQYRPYFLKTSTGQMSYDIFICGKNIAIEYQGKQHFEPVKYFGGEEHFQKQVFRDKLKKELSQKNGIKLIYINYWEDISIDLIKDKIKNIETNI